MLCSLLGALEHAFVCCNKADGSVFRRGDGDGGGDGGVGDFGTGACYSDQHNADAADSSHTLFVKALLHYGYSHYEELKSLYSGVLGLGAGSFEYELHEILTQGGSAELSVFTIAHVLPIAVYEYSLFMMGVDSGWITTVFGSSARDVGYGDRAS